MARPTKSLTHISKTSTPRHSKARHRTYPLKMGHSKAFDPKAILSAAASLAATAMMEFHGLQVNQVFQAANVYLGAKGSNSPVTRIIVGKCEKDKTLSTTIDKNQHVGDAFGRVQVKWKLVCIKRRNYHGRGIRNPSSLPRSDIRFYELTFDKKHRDVVLDAYLPYVVERSKVLQQHGTAITFHMVGRHGQWNPESPRLDHPMSFTNLAMDLELKMALIQDLENFVNRREYYRQIGKAWKRDYLLYGPPGTGKSSLVAAMAKFLNYDIFYLDLTNVEFNADLKSLLMCMSNKSMLVIEDIDCNNRYGPVEYNNKLTLSGLLNFIDGLRSCCIDERIIVFTTTNDKEKLDPALLRPGRMDVHVHMSYCSFSSFRQLAFNYLQVEEHILFPVVENLLEEVKATPAEIAGELMKSCSDAESALQGLIIFLDEKRKQNRAKEDNVVYVENLFDSQSSESYNLPPRSQGSSRRGRGRRGRPVRVILR